MAVVFVLDVTVAAGAIRRETPRQLIGERAGNRALGLEVAVLAQRGFNAALRGETRRARADVDHPGRGVFAEQRPLRAAQDFKLLDVHQVEHRHARPPEVNVVDIQPHAALKAVTRRVVAKAANRHAGLARMHVGDVDAGHQLLQILNPIHPLALQGLATDHAHGRRHILGTFGAAPSGDRDGFQLASGVLAFGRRLVCVGRVAGRPAGTAGQQQRQRQTLEPPGRGRDSGLQQTHKRLRNPEISIERYSFRLFIYVLTNIYCIRDSLYKEST